ncbi:MAG: F0F1 ATP synthase subunit B [Tannerella sp.]|jgi:F-type H+-transporting ATPase subunit b|nr:F0F1 ATP synthase subunit B [Tannerella sp.]
MSLLTPDIGLLFWMALSFAIVFGILAKFGFPVITRMVDERREYIQQSLANADEANRTLESIRQKSEALIEEAKKRRAEIIKQATDDAGRIVQKANEDASAAGKQKLDEALRLIEIQKQKATGEIRSRIAALSVGIAEKILRQQLDSTERHEQLITQLLDEIEDSGRVKNRNNG